MFHHLSDMRLSFRGIYRISNPWPCGHGFALAVWAFCPSAGRVAIHHYVCAVCED